MKSVFIGVDVGNSDTKTPHKSTTSGYKKYAKVPYGAEEVLTYNNSVYVPTLTRFSYVKDKTADEKCFILTLIAIAKEIYSSIKVEGKTKEEVQDEISKYTDLYLGVGLPPAHMATLSENLVKYYEQNFSDKIDFNYEGYDFSLSLKKLGVYPQDYAAVLAFNAKEDFITRKYKTYYAIDIGGYTVDVVPIHLNRPQVEGCKSLELGILKMYSHIASDMNRDFGINVEYDKIEDVLRGEATIFNEEEVAFINNAAQAWTDSIINHLREDGLEFNSNPVVFLGGGSKLLKKNIKNNKLIRLCDFISDPKANAKGYRKILLQEAQI